MPKHTAPAAARWWSADWTCIAQARARTGRPRAPLWVDGVVAGSVAQADLAALAAWPQWLQVDAQGVALTAPAEALSVVLAEVNHALRAQGLIRAWRDEPYPLLDDEDRLCATIERASARFWGTRTFGAHCNGFVADATGRPAQLWIARRSFDKATDPGMLDNLIGGGVPLGQTPREALLREAWEEAGLLPAQMAVLRPGRVLALDCDLPEGRQVEWLHVYDLAMPRGLQPRNQDGEVAEFSLMSVAEALARAANGEMTVDAALCTLDFALRHRLLPADQAERLAEPLATLLVSPEHAARFDPPV
ncbi:DUF4743 domain-containing protein [Ideonella azotifigens]|uniref:NUDIX hydrolase family protein n=1 Tax=Ideonella azotifigens TaxID=513160 RepID=A0ABN1JL24_9BURK|nr:DUF4743 domain-containing protein [Ideonella azotifigens]MCD2339666.1 DUF4743 domain-containing protein [Ideonella azotifigens]